MISVRLEGAVELEQALKKLEPKAGKKVVRDALRPEAKALAEDIKQAAPVLGGSLRRSIRTRAMKRKKNQYGMQVVTISEDPDTTPAFPVETGHRIGSAIIPAIPFVRRPFDRKVDSMARRIEAALWRGINEA